MSSPKKFATDKSAFEYVLQKMHSELGMRPTLIDNGGSYDERIDVSGFSDSEVLKELFWFDKKWSDPPAWVSHTDDAKVLFEDRSGESISLWLVFGNDPSELVADYGTANEEIAAKADDNVFGPMWD